MKKGVKYGSKTKRFSRTNHAWNAVVSFLLERDGDLCAVCKTDLGVKVSIDHVIPKSRGGLDLLSNFQLTHLGCNISHYRKTYKVKKRIFSESHKDNMSIAMEKVWAEIRAGIRPPFKKMSAEKRSAIAKNWWAKKSKEERIEIKKKGWETRRANR